MNAINKVNPISESQMHSSRQASAEPKSGHLEPSSRRLFVALLSTSICMTVTGFGLVVYWMFFFNKQHNDKMSTAEWLSRLHPVLMYFFMFSLNSYSVLLYRTHFNMSKSTLKWTHAMLACVNIVFSLLGVFAMFRSHQLTGKPNFYSLHSWIGVSTNTLYLAQLLAGISVFLRPKTSQSLRTMLMPFHRFVGALILVLACISVVTGVAELVLFQGIPAYVSFTPVTFIANFAAMLSIVSTSISIYLLATPAYLRPTKPDEITPLLRNQ